MQNLSPATAIMTEIKDDSDQSNLGSIVKKHRPELGRYEDIYRDIHQHAELSRKEARTAKVVAAELRRLGYEVTENIGGHGLVGVLRNGEGRTVLLRAELDALPIKEQTGLPYASKEVMVDQYGFERPVMHACGHDMHLTCLLGAANSLKSGEKHWRGTLIVLFQPDEEHTGGAQAMVDDGLYDKVPVPDIVLGQHSIPMRSGRINIRPGVVLAAADTFRIRIFGPAEKTLNPQAGIDPISLAAHVLIRLDSIISSEISPLDFAVINCEEFHAGQPGLDHVDHADILLDVKSYKAEVRNQLHAAIRRVVEEECEVAGAPRKAKISIKQRAPVTSNDPNLVIALRKEFKGYFGDNVDEGEPRRPCEDFSILATSKGKPYVYWFFGTVDTKRWDQAEKEGRLGIDMAQNHSPFNAPSLHPTMETGVDALSLAALTFLA